MQREGIKTAEWVTMNRNTTVGRVVVDLKALFSAGSGDCVQGPLTSLFHVCINSTILEPRLIAFGYLTANRPRCFPVYAAGFDKIGRRDQPRGLLRRFWTRQELVALTLTADHT